jgi:hypothetical protein
MAGSLGDGWQDYAAPSAAAEVPFIYGFDRRTLLAASRSPVLHVTVISLDFLGVERVRRYPMGGFEGMPG